MVRGSSQRIGASRLGCLIQLMIVAIIIYFAKLAGEDALMYYRLQDAMRNEVNFADSRNDAEIRKRLHAFTDSVVLPEQAKDINIVRDENGIRIWSEYDLDIKLPLNHVKTVHLRPAAERKF